MKPHSASLAGGDNEERAHLSPRELRSRMRRGAWDTPTAGLAPGYAQANLVILPRDYAYDRNSGRRTFRLAWKWTKGLFD